MNSLNPTYIIPSAILLFVVAVMVRTAARRLVRARNPRRRVELPNSHYTSPLVRNGEIRHRWQGIDLDGIHEINRDEVVRLLARVEATGVDSLRPAERVFLDHVAGSVQPETIVEVPEPNVQAAPELRESPA
jgi:hypothetical protein